MCACVCVSVAWWLDVSMCVSERIRVCACVCVCVAVSRCVRAKDEVSAISDRRGYVFFSIARRMEKSGV